MASKFYTLRVSDIKKETSDTVSVAFDIQDDIKNQFDYNSGQYLALKAMIDGEEVRRSYSLSSSPHENEWRVAIKLVPNGKFSTYANNELKVGDTIESMAPEGMFQVETNSSESKTYLLVAAGSGITPIISIAKTVLKNEPNSNVVMVYGNKSQDQTIFKSELDALDAAYNNFHLKYSFTKEQVEGAFFGRVDTEKIKEYMDWLNIELIDDVFVCGPEDLIFKVKDGFDNSEMVKHKVHFELFTTPTKNENQESVKASSSMSHVTVIVDDEEFEFEMKGTDGFILDYAQEADADVPFACKGGVCCTCKAMVLEGEVTMDANYALDPDEVEEGYVLTCQSRPVSEKVVLSFDE